ncbi:hypothetical protein WJX81_000972 [Elliptochloris bilobata]|uniref:Las1-like protein n=1 Tax=Elliptochloris bilobata TaxID=381761 RepID=A0AAW1S8W6_9CHLO
MLGRVVPWVSWEEWHSVRQGLFSQSWMLQQECLDQVQAWRCRGRIPLGADVTASLVETCRRDTSPGGSGSRVPAELLRLQYAMSIVRLVNGIADSAQKGRTALSVASLAEDAGLPRLLVDVRHEAAHNELPALALLRLAACAALTWLAASYWQRQADHLAACRSRIAELLQEYAQLQRAAPLRSARLVLVDLRERVPLTAASLLVAPLLDEGILDPPEAARGADPAARTASPAQAAWQASLQAWQDSAAQVPLGKLDLRSWRLAG